MTIPDLPNPCTPGQLFTLKGKCNQTGDGGTAFWLVDPSSGSDSVSSAAAPHPLESMLPQLVKLKFTPEQVIQLAEAMKPGKCGG
jgi:hypothetical protein